MRDITASIVDILTPNISAISFLLNRNLLFLMNLTFSGDNLMSLLFKKASGFVKWPFLPLASLSAALSALVPKNK